MKNWFSIPISEFAFSDFGALVAFSIVESYFPNKKR